MTALPEPAISETRRIVIAFIIAIAFLMQGIDSTMLANAIPTMGREMGISPLLLHLAVTAYLLSLAVFMPVSGWFADKFGSRRMFCGALVVFTVGSAFCGLAPNLQVLVVARFLQGIGGAMMTPVGRMIVLRAFGQGRALDANSYLTMPLVIGPLVGPLFGAFILSVSSWRWIFYVNVPICVLGIVLTLLYVPPDEPAAEKRRFDVSGFLLSGLALTLFELDIEHIGHPVLGPWGTVYLFVATVAVATIYFFHARRVEHPALELAVFRIRTFAVGVVGGGLGRVGLNSTGFLIPLMLQLGFGLHPLTAALYSATAAFGSFGSKQILRALIRRFGFRRALVSFALVGSAMMAGFFLARTGVSLILLVPYVIAMGAVRTMFFNSVNALTYSDLPQNMLSRGVSVASVFQQLSMGMGVTAGATVLSIIDAGRGLPALSDFGTAFVIMAVVPLLAIPPLLLLRPAHGKEARAVSSRRRRKAAQLETAVAEAAAEEQSAGAAQ